MTTLSRVGEIVRHADPDRFLCTLFAPAPQRETLFALYAFNNELARAREAVREPMMALIRLQWWREVVEGARRRHEVATPLADAIDRGALDPADLLALIEAREEEQEEEAWPAFVARTAGRLALAAGRALGAADPALTAAGSAYGAAGLLRNRALNGQAPIAGLREAGAAWLAEARGGAIARAAWPAALPAALAARDLARAAPVRVRGLGDKLAVLRAAVTGRL